MQELSDKVWLNPNFQKAAVAIELAWLANEIGIEAKSAEKVEIGRLIRAAAILACSENYEHRQTAFRIATYAYELFGTSALPLDQALRVILARLGNFPSIDTREDVRLASSWMPWTFVADEFSLAEKQGITVNREHVLLTNFQHELWTRLADGQSVAMSAPTSAGKSFVLQKYIVSQFEPETPRSVIYIVPTRALIAQVADDLSQQAERLNGTSPRIVTIPLDSEAKLDRRAIYVMTQERVQLAMASHGDFVADVIVVDEAHGVADGSRGVLLQWVIDDLLDRNPKSQVIFASPTIRNRDVFGRLFGLNDVVESATIESTVAQNFLLIQVMSASKGRISIQSAGDGSKDPVEIGTLQLDRTTASRLDKLVHVSARLSREQSAIVYANGAADAESIALQLCDLFADLEPTQNRLALAELVSESVHPRYALVECVKRGVAFHYSNIPTNVRRAIERAVSNGDIKFLVCTSTLLQGVNLPAKNIFMCLPEKGHLEPMESTDFWNLAGRAGRLRREFHGNIFLIDYSKWKKRPLVEARDAVVVPAIEKSVKERKAQLLNVIANGPQTSRKEQIDLETAFVRLFSDLKRDSLRGTLQRIGLNVDDPGTAILVKALKDADEKVFLPAEVIRRTPNISAHKQQRMFERLKQHVDRGASNSKSAHTAASTRIWRI